MAMHSDVWLDEQSLFTLSSPITKGDTFFHRKEVTFFLKTRTWWVEVLIIPIFTLVLYIPLFLLFKCVKK